jgi:ABC-type Fe3+/spermidine/putrescine transport system ATPase subunit
MIVQIAGLERHYGGETALSGIDLDVADGEFLALLGPSGAGKTTLLRLIAGLDRPDAGAVVIDGKDIRSLSARPPDRLRVPELCAVSPHERRAKHRLRSYGEAAPRAPIA